MHNTKRKYISLWKRIIVLDDENKQIATYNLNEDGRLKQKIKSQNKMSTIFKQVISNVRSSHTKPVLPKISKMEFTENVVIFSRENNLDENTFFIPLNDDTFENTFSDTVFHIEENIDQNSFEILDCQIEEFTFPAECEKTNEFYCI